MDLLFAATADAPIVSESNKHTNWQPDLLQARDHWPEPEVRNRLLYLLCHNCGEQIAGEQGLPLAP